MAKKTFENPISNSIVSIENVEHFKWGKNCDGWWFKKQDNFTAIYEIMRENTSEVKHYHEAVEQFFYLLERTFGMELGDDFFELKIHQGITIPPNISHKAINSSNQVDKFLVISSPDSHIDRINVENE